MLYYHWLLLFGFLVCISCATWQLVVVIRNRSRDYAAPRGNSVNAILYAFTAAMSPLHKESASRHLPSYLAGIFFHLGIFIAFFWLVISFFGIQISITIRSASWLFMSIAAICGGLLFLKRLFYQNLRFLSHPDDYFSNLLVTAFLALSAATLRDPSLVPWLFVWSTFLLLYMPISKLRHSFYFFSSRIFLGQFFGKRGVWQFKR